MRLLLTSPKIAALSCADCQAFMTDENWDFVLRNDKRIPLAPGMKLKCWKCPKIPSGMPAEPSSAQDLSDANLAAYRHYRECRAVGHFPDDPQVREDAALIMQVEESVQQSRQQFPVELLLAALGMKKR